MYYVVYMSGSVHVLTERNGSSFCINLFHAILAQFVRSSHIYQMFNPIISQASIAEINRTTACLLKYKTPGSGIVLLPLNLDC